MQLTSVQIRMFRNILDTGEVRIDPGVTCLVGKNESGKTAFLEALKRINPAQGKPAFDVLTHYPAWREKVDRRKGLIEKTNVVTVELDFDPADEKALSKIFGPAAFTSKTVKIERHYDGTSTYYLSFDEAAAAAFLWESLGLKEFIVTEQSVTSLPALQAAIAAAAELDGAEATAAAATARLTEILKDRETLKLAAVSTIALRLPKFFYFASYSTLPGVVKIKELLAADMDDLDVNSRTARSLLLQAGAEDDYLLDPDYQKRVRELENVANSITQDILRYWTTNDNLRVKFDITQKTVQRNNGQTSVMDELHIRMDDSKHFLSLPFNERSTGFQWFFSFLAAFSEFEYGDENVIILLDEPAVSLHAKAQRDFLKFIKERLSPVSQVIYTTHSPFMIEPDELSRVRIVEDKGTEKGAIVSSDVLTVDQESLFPLQGALGYDLAQHLFISPHNLVVEGTSDLTYLKVFSDHLKAAGRTGLDDRWTIVPVGGADLVPTFVALLGTHLDVTVLVDARKEGHQRLNVLQNQGLLEKKRLITIGDVLARPAADIEDLFSTEDYLVLYNAQFGRKYTADELKGGDPIVRRLARAEGADRFDHGLPAQWLLMNRSEILPKLSAETLAQFEKLFQRINATI